MAAEALIDPLASRSPGAREAASSRLAEPPRWGRWDVLALLAWTVAVVLVFPDAALLRGAFFYFDMTDLNYPYRAFLFRELAAGRFSRWMPDLDCGLPLFCESQAGYFHPLKYALYPWMSTWKAFNLDTLLSVWLTGVGGYGWLRRHVGPIGALTGAAVLGLGGYTWAHLIHTSMVNALASVPFAFWAMEASWGRGRFRAMALGSVAVACQVFAGHLQDTILTCAALGLYAAIRALGERSWSSRARALGMAAGMVALAAAISSVQWIPSKELLDRSPRSGGLKNSDMTYGSWHPELLPAVLVREIYGTRARDTDWIDGYYPYHEMDTYLGLSAMFLAALGASSWRDRWAGSWLGMGAVGLLLMLGRHTFLMDFLHRAPVVGSSRIPVRLHLWVTLAAAALAAVGADRLARGGAIRLRGPVGFVAALGVISAVIAAFVYTPILTQASRWTQPEHFRKFDWLRDEVGWAILRDLAIFVATVACASRAARSVRPRGRMAWSAALPLLCILDLGASHAVDAPTVDPSYWTTPPASVAALRAEPNLIRIYGEGTFSSGEPGYASRAVPFPAVRETLAWSLPAAWGVPATAAHTPLISRRRVRFGEWNSYIGHRMEGLSHILSTTPSVARLGPFTRAGGAYIHRNPAALPRARIVGRPAYAEDERSAMRLLRTLGHDGLSRVVVEDPDRPLPESAAPIGTAEVIREIPERVEVRVRSDAPAYLVLSDTFDPGWSATVDGRPAPIRPANVAFRAVLIPAGEYSVVFTYSPVGFRAGLIVSGIGLLLAAICLIRPGSRDAAEDGQPLPPWGQSWPIGVVAATALAIGLSIPSVDRNGRLGIQERWMGTFHPFTWGAKIEAIKPPPPPLN